jgi:hypothetical protein
MAFIEVRKESTGTLAYSLLEENTIIDLSFLFISHNLIYNLIYKSTLLSASPL